MDSIENENEYQVLENQIEEIKEIVVDNIDKALQRGDNVQLLIERSNELETDSLKFNQSAYKLKVRLCKRSVFIWVFGTIGVLLIIFFIIVSACGGFSFKKCS